MREQDRAVLAASQEVKAAVQELGQRLMHTQLSPSQLQDTARHVRALADDLDGPDRPPWWEGSKENEGLVGYRHRSLFSGPLHFSAPPVVWDERSGPEGQPGYTMTTTLSELYQGPPRAAHGGWVAGTFDELLGAVQGRSAGGGGFTGRLTVRYRSFTPLDEEVVFHGWIVDERSRRIVTHATCHAGHQLTAEAEGLFVRPGTLET